jgi:hypothetical protein
VRDREEQPAGVHGGAPELADATAGSKSPWRKTAEDVRQQLIREILHAWL